MNNNNSVNNSVNGNNKKKKKKKKQNRLLDLWHRIIDSEYMTSTNVSIFIVSFVIILSLAGYLAYPYFNSYRLANGEYEKANYTVSATRISTFSLISRNTSYNKAMYDKNSQKYDGLNDEITNQMKSLYYMKTKNEKDLKYVMNTPLNEMISVGLDVNKPYGQIFTFKPKISSIDMYTYPLCKSIATKYLNGFHNVFTEKSDIITIEDKDAPKKIDAMCKTFIADKDKQYGLMFNF